MLISLHKNATTTLATRLVIQQAHGTGAELAQRFRMGKFTIRRWRKRTFVAEGSRTPHWIQPTQNAGWEEIVVYLRTHLRLSLNTLMRERMTPH